MVTESELRILARAEWKATELSPKPDVSFIPPMERRRLTAVEKAALSVAWKCLEQYKSSFAKATEDNDLKIPTVFSSRWGEIGTTVKLMRQMFEEGEMSPAGFSNSVHNAAPGHLSLLLKNTAPYTAIAAGADSYAMGLLEASTYPGKVLFVYAEEETPELYRPYFPHPESAHAVALLIDNEAK